MMRKNCRKKEVKEPKKEKNKKEKENWKKYVKKISINRDEKWK